MNLQIECIGQNVYLVDTQYEIKYNIGLDFLKGETFNVIYCEQNQTFTFQNEFIKKVLPIEFTAKYLRLKKNSN